MAGGRPREVKRIYIHTSLSQPVYDRMEALLMVGGKIKPGDMRDFIEDSVELMFQRLDEDLAVRQSEGGIIDNLGDVV